MTPRLLALDWGSSQLRAWLMGPNAELLQERCSADGASRLQPGPAAFEQALRSLTGDWLAAYPQLPILACGMVGSAHGWREAPYVTCPVALDDLHRQAVLVQGTQGLQLRLIPGLCQRPANQPPDVMRGEETQLAGLLAQQPQLARTACVVMPGTHSKGVELRGGQVHSFATRMTGELFAVLREHSVLGRLLQPSSSFDDRAFAGGVRAARESGGADLGRLLFAVRTLGLFDQLPRESLADYLSGLLIACELVCALQGLDAQTPLVLVGEPTLCDRYALAIGLLCGPGRSVMRSGERLAAHGLWHFAERAGWT